MRKQWTDQENWASSEQTSGINEAYVKMLRLANIWNKVNAYKSRGNIDRWGNELNNALDELISDARILLKQEDYDKYVKKNLALANKNIIKAGTDKSKRFYWLRYKERIIRHIQNLTGRGTKIVTIKDKGKAIYLD